MPEAVNNFREPLNRPLTHHERDLVRWLIDHSHKDVSSLLPQIDRLSVVTRCTSGCPTIDFALDGKPVVTKGEQLVSDWLAEVEGMPGVSEDGSRRCEKQVPAKHKGTTHEKATVV